MWAQDKDGKQGNIVWSYQDTFCLLQFGFNCHNHPFLMTKLDNSIADIRDIWAFAHY